MNSFLWSIQNKPLAKRIEEVKRSSPEPWRAAETVWEITEDYQTSADMPPLGMVLFTILTDGQHPYGLTGRKESVAPAMKVFKKTLSYNKLSF